MARQVTLINVQIHDEAECVHSYVFKLYRFNLRLLELLYFFIRVVLVYNISKIATLGLQIWRRAEHFSLLFLCALRLNIAQ